MLIKRFVLFIGICLANHATCQDNRIQHPQKNFDRLWEVTYNKYCNFDLLDINWKERYDHYKKKITDSTTNDELFVICGDLLKELDDGHVWLSRKDKFEPNFIESGTPSKFYTEFPTNETAFRFIDVSDSILFSHGFSQEKIVKPNEANVGVLEYSFSDSLAYLKINAMEGISNLRVNKVMREMVDSLKSRQGLIIDIRFNGGGYDTRGYQVARYLTTCDRLSMYKHIRKPKTNEFRRLKKQVVKANRRRNYSGPVVLLTSDYTISAADVFAVTLRDFPNATIVGDHTAGFFSDVHSYRLPNGWKFSLSRLKYYAHDMTNYERIGVPPDHFILNTMQSCKEGKDPVLQKVLELLNVHN